MAWRRTGEMPLSEPVMVRFPTHICVTRPQWVKVKTPLKLVRYSLTHSTSRWSYFILSTRLNLTNINPNFLPTGSGPQQQQPGSSWLPGPHAVPMPQQHHRGPQRLRQHSGYRLQCKYTEKVCHYNDGIMSAMASQIGSLAIVCSTVYSGTDQRKHQSSASLAFVRGIHRWPVDSPHKGPVTRKMFSFDGVIMYNVPLVGTDGRLTINVLELVVAYIIITG